MKRIILSALALIIGTSSFGGNIEQELLAILVQRQYQVWQPRGTEPAGRPFTGFFGPKNRAARLALGVECGDVSRRIPGARPG